MNDLRNTEFTVISKSILSCVELFTHDELLIILLLHAGSKTSSVLKSRLSMSQTRFQKSISFLQNNGFIESSGDVFSLGVSADLSALQSRDGRPFTSLNLGPASETTSMFTRSVVNYESFAPTLAMPAKCRELSYMLFDRMGWDPSKPFDRIVNIHSWVKECRQLLVLSNNDLRLVRDAIDLLKEKNYSITSPRSLLKTVASIKNGNSLNFTNKQDQDSAPEIF